jgi:hypothetical protein
MSTYPSSILRPCCYEHGCATLKLVNVLEVEYSSAKLRNREVVGLWSNIGRLLTEL